ncbi:MAG: cation:proton antiporter [Candidatus Methanoperedens sp.]|nr:cation:proton antiporter [Candidatus Methanoperedens sp.]PKL53145.1 MAG: potassium transporter KefB [Candidatus Methanoperedenaceae archaeon HGW-Methanoperedenaceae-1]
MDGSLLNDFIIIFGLSIAILFIFHQLRIPVIVGFLLTGVVAGPHGLGIISGIQQVETIAEIGIIFLLFTIGVEFSLKELLNIRKLVLIGGSLQVILTIAFVFFIASQLGFSSGEAVFIGFLISLSSTAIVLKLLQERAEIDSPQGKASLGILIFQDIIVVAMILVTPLLAGNGGFEGSLLIMAAKGIGIIVLVFVSAQWIVPAVLYQIARTRSRELFLFSIFFICFSIAILTERFGLSLALGAFLAGLIISESEYSHQALGNIMPFRDIFMSLFFVSIGMLLDINFLFQKPVLIIIIALCVIVLKSAITGFSTTLLGYPLRTTIIVGLSLAQVGEFSFILSGFGIENGILSRDTYQLFLAVSILTMASTPLMINAAPKLAGYILRLPLPKKLVSGLYPMPGIAAKKIRLKDHLIIIGFGLNGRNVARAARVAGIPYTILEMNPETVRMEKSKGESIYYGDATSESVLEHVNIQHARVLVMTIADPAATRRITSVSRKLTPKLHIIARTRYINEMKSLYNLGANEVIPEEFETSVEIFARVLKKYLIPRDEIEKFIAEVQADGYEMFRSLSKEGKGKQDFKLDLPDIEIDTLKVEETSTMAGKTLAEMNIRRKFGVTVLAIRRGSQTLPNPDGDETIHAGDTLIVLGLPDKISVLTGVFFNPGSMD